MSLQHTILGFLSWRPLTGYDLKKLFAETEFIPWSGNNNQIYKSLIALSEQGLVDAEVEQPETGPSRKVYTITESGKTALKTWLLSTPEMPEYRNTFHVQLAWTEGLESRHLKELLQEYLKEISMRILVLKEMKERKVVYPGRSERERLIWDRIMARHISIFEHEKEWAETLAADLADHQ